MLIWLAPARLVWMLTAGAMLLTSHGCACPPSQAPAGSERYTA